MLYMIYTPTPYYTKEAIVSPNDFHLFLQAWKGIGKVC